MLESYSPSVVESEIDRKWREVGFIEQDSHGETYTIMMPPPNVTGSLHMGHALNFTLQDVIVRFQRMRGYNVLWQPGFDHAGIATQMLVESFMLKEYGLTKEEIEC